MINDIVDKGGKATFRQQGAPSVAQLSILVPRRTLGAQDAAVCTQQLILPCNNEVC